MTLLRPVLWPALASFCVIGAHAQPFYNFSLEKVDDPAYGGSAVWIDFNADGNLDLFLTGRGDATTITGEDDLLGRLYRHVGIVASFSGPMHRLFEHDLDVGVWMSGAAWSDYDGDGDLDLFLCGASALEPPYAPIARLYRFDGGFPLQAVQEFDGLYGCAADWGDFDNDGDPDLVVAGASDSGTNRTLLLRNEEGTLVPVPTTLPAVAFGAVKWADADNDGDLDLALSGMDAAGPFVTDVFINDGGSFHASGAPMKAVAFGSLDWGDYDNDADLDLLVTGAYLGPMLATPHSAVYRNEGAGTFSTAEFSIVGKYGSNAVWADWDSDGDLDYFDAGTRSVLRPAADIHENVGGTIRRVNNPCPVPPGSCLPFEPVTLGSALVFDMDKDYDLDLMLIGLDDSRRRFVQIDRNDIVNIPRPDSDIRAKNLPPRAPDGLEVQVDGNTVDFSWLPASDVPVPFTTARTRSEGLSYNLRVGTSPGAVDVMPPMALLDDGRRQVVRPGNVGSNRDWHLTLPSGRYYWSVQAIDHSFAGSPFSSEATFVIP